MPTDAELLDQFADLLIQAVTADDSFEQRTMLVHLRKRDGVEDNFDLGFKDIDGRHVAQEIVGFTAPSEWWALGGITGGWAAPMDDGAEHESARGRTTNRPSAHPDAVRIVSVFLLDRTGHMAARVRFADGRSIDEPPSVGFTVDAFHRAMGLPTAPPAVPVAELYLSMWLSFVASAGDQAQRDGRKGIGWAQAVKLHPGLPDARRSAKRLQTAGGFVAALAEPAAVSWSDLRRWAGRGSLGPLVSPSLARWMDEGMLCRWLLGEMAPLADLVDRACARVVPDAAAKLREAVDLLLLRAQSDVA